MGKTVFMMAAAVSILLTAALVADETADKIKKARVDVEALSSLVEVYKLNNGNYPKSIKTLAEPQPSGAAPLVPEEKLKDPWGQMYEIDPKGPKNKGRKADVWSKGPSKNDPKGLIGNWQVTSPNVTLKAPRQKDKASPAAIEEKLDRILKKLEDLEKRLERLEKKNRVSLFNGIKLK